MHSVAQTICTFILGVSRYQFFSFEVLFTKQLLFGRSGQNVADSVFFELGIQFLVLSHFFKPLELLSISLDSIKITGSFGSLRLTYVTASPQGILDLK